MLPFFGTRYLIHIKEKSHHSRTYIYGKKLPEKKRRGGPPPRNFRVKIMTRMIQILPEMMNTIVVRYLLSFFNPPFGDHEDLVPKGADPHGVGFAGVVEQQQGWEHSAPDLWRKQLFHGLTFFFKSGVIRIHEK